MDRKDLMKVILQGEAAFLLMAFAFYLVVRNLSTIYGWIVFLAWLTFAMYVVEAAARLFKVQKRLPPDEVTNLPTVKSTFFTVSAPTND